MARVSRASSDEAPNRFSIPALSLCEEAAPQTYRKICLNGWLLLDKEPAERDRRDQELEQSCVDALTLQLRHQTTDIYVPLLKSDFALAVRRNVKGASWLREGALAPADCPDLPFGNCWRSGVAANIHVIKAGESDPVYLYATDEQGTIHRFVEVFESGRPNGFHPIPSAGHEQESGAMNLSRDGEGNWVFRRKFGTTLVYSAREIVRDVQCDEGRVERRRFYPLISASDCRGVRFEHVFHSGNDGLVPDEITYKTRRIQIERNSKGCVSRLINPCGGDFLFNYREPKLPGGAPLLTSIDRPVISQKRGRTAYEYDETPECRPKGKVEIAAYHTNICSITDPNGNTYKFEYAFDSSRLESAGGIEQPAVGMQRCVRRVLLPGGMGSASFTNYSALSADPAKKSRRITHVADAEGNGRIYHFLDPSIISLPAAPFQRAHSGTAGAAAPRFAVFRALQITHCQGIRHRMSRKGEVRPGWPSKAVAREMYEFDLYAGMALEKATDMSGGVTQYLHEDSHDDRAACIPDPFHVKRADPTSRINPMGGIRKIKYDPALRLIVEREDELGRVTAFTRDTRRGSLLAEATYETRQAFEAGKPFALTDFEYSDARFPAFATRKIVRKLPLSRTGPAWEQDLITDFEADDLGELGVEIRDPGGLRRVSRFVYDPSANKTSVCYPNGFFIQFRYDSLSRLVRVYRPRQNAKRNYYDPRGNKIREVLPDGEVTVYEWDALTRQVRSCTGSDAEVKIKSKAPCRFNALNTLIFNPDVKSESRAMTVDALQRLVKLRHGSGAVVRYWYGENCGSLLFDISAMNSTSARRQGNTPTMWAYDACHRKIEEAVFGHTPAFFQYDAADNLMAEVDAGGKWTRHEYDALNRRVKTTLPNGKIHLTLYTSTGLEYESVNEHGVAVVKSYDGAGEEIEDEK